MIPLYRRLSIPAGRTLTAILLLLTAVGITVVVFVPTEQVLIITDIQTNEIYLTQPVETGSTVALRYTHSVEKTPVSDEYRVEGTRLVHTRMEFESYGWGLPSGVNVSTVNGTFVYDPQTPITTLESLIVSPGRIAEHTLVVDNHQHDLVALTNASDVQIRVDRRPLAANYP